MVLILLSVGIREGPREGAAHPLGLTHCSMTALHNVSSTVVTFLLSQKRTNEKYHALTFNSARLDFLTPLITE